MADRTELLRRLMIAAGMDPEGDEPVWTTETLQEEFEVEGFMAPFVVVRRKSDGKRGSLMFRHSPRIYFRWQEDVR